MMRMGGAPSHPDGESLVNLIERCLHFQADYGKEAAQKLSDDERDARRAARKTELAQAAKIAAQCVNDTRLSIYHRGLGARLLACALSQPEASPKLAEQAQESAVHLLDIMNQSSSGITRDHGPVRLSPVDRHRVGVNCAAALAHVHAAASGRSAARMRGNIQRLDANIMCMSPLPEAFSLESEEDLADQRRRIADAVLRHARYGGGANFWVNAEEEARATTRGSAMTRGSSSNFSIDGMLMPPSTASTGGSSVMLDPRDFYKQSNDPTHRPMTQYSEIAGNMGLYDPDVREEMRILKERHDREKQDRSLGGGANQQHQLSIDQEVMDIEVDSNNATKGNSMLGSLEAGLGSVYSPPSSAASSSQKRRRRLRSRAFRHKNNMPQGSATYADFIRVMLSTPMQGPASRGLKHRHPAQNDASHPLNELSHSVRRNWTCMPEYLEALGILSNYPMDKHQQSPKVQRMARKIKDREARSIQAWGKRQPETNTGVLYGSDPSGLGSTTLKMVLGGGDNTNKERRKSGLLDPKLLGYTKSMMWYPQARLQPAAQGSSPTKLVIGAAASATVAEQARNRPGSPSAQVLEQELERDVQGGDWRDDQHPVEVSSPYAKEMSLIARKKHEATEERVRARISLNTWAGRGEPRPTPLYLAIDLDKLERPTETRMPWGVEGTGSRILVADADEINQGEVLTARAAEIIEERVARAPSEIRRLDNLMSRLRGQQRGISQLLYMNIDMLRRELPIQFLLSLKARGKFPEFNVQVIRDRAYLMLAAWAEEMRLRALARALVPWWQLVVRQRAREYRAGVGVRLLKATLYRMTLRLMRRKVYSWIRWAAWQRFEERNAAAMILQKQYRGYKGRMEFLELLRRHLAAIPIQTAWRRVWALVNYRIDYANIITAQRIARGLIARRMVAEWHRCATMFQTAVRMFPRRVEYLIIAESIVKAQTIYRAWLARKVFYHYFELRVRKFEVEMTMAAVIQRNWRGVGPRVEAKRRRAEIERREAAALHIQNWWYRVQDGFASFFLMRLLSVQEEQSIAQKKELNKRKRLAAVALVQRRVRGWKARRRVQEIKRKGRIAAQIQKIYRGRSTRRAIARYRLDLHAVIKIQQFYRVAREKRNAAARILQRMYLVSGRPEGKLFDIEKIRAHVKMVADRIEAERRAVERRAAYRAARLVQQMIRRKRAKKEVFRIKSAIHIQSFLRVCLARAERLRRYLVWCHDTGMKLVVLPTLREALARASNHVRMLQKSAATKIQTRIRIFLATRERLRRADYIKRATASSIIISNWWKNRMQAVVVANLTELAACAKANVFRCVVDREGKVVPTGKETVHQMLTMAKAIIQRYIAISEVSGLGKNLGKVNYEGLDVATMLLRLGMGDHAAAVKKVIHNIERKLVGNRYSGLENASLSPKKKRRNKSPKKAKTAKKKTSQSNFEIASSADAKSSSGTAKHDDLTQHKSGVVATKSPRGLARSLADSSTKPRPKSAKKPLPPGFPEDLPRGPEFDWLNCPENGEIALLRSLLQVDQYRSEILSVIAKGSPRAVKAAEAIASGKKLRPKIKKEKVVQEDGTVNIVETNLDEVEDHKYAIKMLSRVEMLLGLLHVPDAKAKDPESNHLRLLQSEVVEGFSIIEDKRQLRACAQTEFKRCYPRNANRAGRFANKCPLGVVSLLQLKAYLERFGPSGASRAFDSFDMLTKEWPGWERINKSNPGLASEAKHWNNVRTRRGFELVQMCAERFCSILENGPYTELLSEALRKARRKWHWRRPWVQDSNLLYQCPKRAPGRASLYKPLKNLTRAMHHVMQADIAAQRIQLRYRARLTTLLYRNIKSQLVLARASEAYHREMAELYDGTKVRAVAEADRIKEKREYQVFLVEQELARREEALWYTVAWPFEEVWDDSAQAYVYYRTDLKNGEVPEPQFEKPVYTIDQENNVLKLQKWARWLREMRLMREWTRRDDLAKKERALQEVWDAERESRERLVSIKLSFVDAEPGFMLSVGLRPTIKLAIPRRPNAQTLSQAQQQLERLQDYAERIESRVAAESAFPQPKLLPTGKYASPPPAPTARLIKHFEARIAATENIVKLKEQEKRDRERAQRRKYGSRPKSRERKAAKVAAMTTRQRAKLEKERLKNSKKDLNIGMELSMPIEQKEKDSVPTLQPLFPSCPCMLNPWCSLPHGHTGSHIEYKAGIRVVTPFGEGKLLECCSIVDTTDSTKRTYRNNQLVAEAILTFWEKYIKKQRAPSLPQIPSPAASLTTNAGEIRASIQTIPSRILKKLLEGVRAERANLEGRDVQMLGYCSDAQCVELIANEMRAIHRLERKIRVKDWQKKNRIMAVTMATKIKRPKNGREAKSLKKNSKKGKKRKTGGSISGVVAAESAMSEFRGAAKGDSTKLLRKKGLFGTGRDKFFAPMCRVQLNYGVTPIVKMHETKDTADYSKNDSYQELDEDNSENVVTTKPHNENYAIAMVRKKDMKWYPPKAIQEIKVETEINYTLVEMPLGWVEVQNYDGSVFYANENTGETTWDRPEYSVKEDLNAVIVQRFMRGWYGRICFKRMLRNTSMLDIVRDCVNHGSLIAWIGYGMEGMDVELYFTRLAMYELCPLVQRWRKDRAGKKVKIKGIKGRVQLYELLAMDDEGLKSMGIKNKIYRRRIIAMNQRVKHDAEWWDQDSVFFTPRYPKLMNEFQLHGSRGAVPKRKHYGGLLKDLPELPPGCLLEQGEIIDMGEEFGYVSRGQSLREMFLKKHKSHEKRADDFPDVIEDSETPVTFSMIHAYLDKHGGRAKAAADCAADLQNLASISPPEECAKVCRLYYRCAERLIMIVKKLGMPTLQWKLVQALRKVSPMMKVLSDLDEERERNLQKKKEEAAAALKAAAKGETRKRSVVSRDSSSADIQLKEKDGSEISEIGSTPLEEKSIRPERLQPGKQFQLPPGPLFCVPRNQFPLAMSVAQIIRDAMQWVFRFNRAATKVQSAFRCYVMKRDGRAHRAYVRALMTKVQARWRGALGRRIGLALRWQFESQWEQLFDEKRHTYYFYNNHTRTSQWQAPFVPFRPFGWWPEPEPEKKALHGFCSRCYLEKATRRCHVCVDKDTSLNLEFCFACFAIAHRESADLQAHGFEVIVTPGSGVLECVECHDVATRKCLDCDDAYCKAHFQRMHRRGNRKNHRSYGFAVGAPVCIECDNDVAVKFCNGCGDQFCLNCFLHVHRKGKKKFHKATAMDENITDGLDVYVTYVTEQRRIEKEKANADSSDEEEAPHDKSAPKTPLPISNKAFGKRKGKLGRNPANSGAKKPHKPPPRRNLRKEQALAAHSKAGTLPVRRNRPKNWRQLRPDKPPPPKRREAEIEEGNI